jgi:hypothetical protein
MLRVKTRSRQELPCRAIRVERAVHEIDKLYGLRYDDIEVAA